MRRAMENLNHPGLYFFLNDVLFDTFSVCPLTGLRFYAFLGFPVWVPSRTSRTRFGILRGMISSRFRCNLASCCKGMARNSLGGAFSFGVGMFRLAILFPPLSQSRLPALSGAYDLPSAPKQIVLKAFYARSRIRIRWTSWFSNHIILQMIWGSP